MLTRPSCDGAVQVQPELIVSDNNCRGSVDSTEHGSLRRAISPSRAAAQLASDVILLWERIYHLNNVEPLQFLYALDRRDL